MGIAFADELFDAQFLRALAPAAAGGADQGECFTTAARIAAAGSSGKGTAKDADLEHWYAEWSATAERVAAAAETELAAGRTVSARGGFFRASNYLRTAGLFLLQTPVDERVRRAYRRQTETFRQGAALLPRPPQILQIPYERTTLPGYFFPAGRADDGPRPLLILTDGYDGTMEELWFAVGAAAVERGYHVLAFDGPGQGTVIIEQGIPFRPDWETVITPVVDHALTLPGVDPDRIALYGWSFGGYLAPRAVTAEHRIAACVSDCGPYDLGAALVERIPKPLRAAAAELPKVDTVPGKILSRIMLSVMAKPTAGWSLRRNVLVHGLSDPLDFFAIAGDYSLKGRETSIRCPVLVSAVDGDDLSVPAASTFARALPGPAEYVQFGAADGVTGHCETNGRTVFLTRMFAWLESVLGPVR